MATRDPSLFGRTDPVSIPLTQWGYEQAVATGSYIRETLGDALPAGKNLHIYYSPHTRIVQSKDGFLQGIAETLPYELHEEPLIAERDHGDFNGLDSHAQNARNSVAYGLLHSSDIYTRYHTPMPGGESLADVQQRIDKFIDKLRQNSEPDDNIVIITHGANCRALEESLIHYGATWISEFPPPETGDIIRVTTDLRSPGTSQQVLSGKKRAAQLPSDYKAEAYGGSTVLAYA